MGCVSSFVFFEGGGLFKQGCLFISNLPPASVQACPSLSRGPYSCEYDILKCELCIMCDLEGF